jgi:hypothetical protein
MDQMEWLKLADLIEEATESERVDSCPDGCCATYRNFVDGEKLVAAIKSFAINGGQPR